MARRASGKKMQRPRARRGPLTRLTDEQLLRLEERVMRSLAGPASYPEGLREALRAVCETAGWQCAAFWQLAEAEGAMKRCAEWFDPAAGAARRFMESSGGLTVTRGAGLVGAVWESAEPLWRDDAALFPVRSGDRVAGVVAYACKRVRPPSARLQQAMQVLAAMFGEPLRRAAAEQALRESEARFRSLTDLSSDWYWEQDAEYRFRRLEGRHVAGGDPALLGRLIGARRWETGLQIEGGWEAHRRLIEAHQPFYDTLMWRSMADGSMRYMRVSGEPVFDGERVFRGYRGIGRDVTAQQRERRLLELEHHIAGALASAGDAAAGLQAVMRAVCDSEAWSCARYLRLEGDRLVCEEAWSTDDPSFLASSRGLAYRRSEGLAGAVLQGGAPVWSPDATRDPRVHRAALVGVPETRGLFAFAVSAEERPIGVFTFSSTTVREPDRRLLDASRVIGSQVGQFLQRKQAEEALRESEARFRSLTQMSSDFFWEADAAHRLTELAHGPDYPDAYMGRGLLGKAAWELPSLSPDEDGWAAHRSQLERQEPFRDFEFSRRMPDGAVRYFSVSGEPRFAGDGRFLGYRGVGRDITEIALARERISSLAYSDPLTGLANRASLGVSLEQAVQRARRRNARLAAVFIDLDGFKQVNDFYGHDIGDALLVEVAGRLRAQLRAGDLVARLGGDEFLVMLEDVHEAAPVETVAKKLLAALARPYRLAGREATVTASIGVSMLPDDAADAAALMKHADTAMYEAKQKGKNTYAFYRAGPAANDTEAAGGERQAR